MNRDFQLDWPAEWATQQATLIVWPHQNHDWQSQLSEVTRSYIQMAKAISAHQALWIIAWDKAHQDQILSLLNQVYPKYPIEFILAPTNDTWVRDTGPICIKKNNKIHCLDFQFNAWGGKYDWALDNQINQTLKKSPPFADYPFQTFDFILEGGSIESDGQGTLMTTQCLKNPNRNKGWQTTDINQFLETTLGVEQCLWLEVPPLPGDDTDGHIDTLARFCPNQVITYLKPTQRQDNLELEAQLKRFKSLSGQSYELIPLPFKPVENEDGRLLAASYANFLIINQAVLVPQYGNKLDDLACKALELCFPGYTIHPIDALSFIRQGGSVHCLTMQIIKQSGLA